jgi:hypothetical protein
MVCFVDSDVLLCRDWYKKASQFVAPDVGAVWGTEVWSTIQNRTVMKYFLLVTRKIFEIRGGTHDTLIRTQAVRGIHIPWNLHVFEDAFIKDYIEDHEYRVVACYDPFCMHFRPKSVWTFKGSLSVLVESLRVGRPSLLLRLVLAYGFYTVYSVSQMFAGE